MTTLTTTKGMVVGRRARGEVQVLADAPEGGVVVLFVAHKIDTLSNIMFISALSKYLVSRPDSLKHMYKTDFNESLCEALLAIER